MHNCENDIYENGVWGFKVLFKLYHIFMLVVVLGSASQVKADSSVLTEVTDALGFKNTATLWPPGTHALYEIMGSGVALFDYNNDDMLDVLHIRFPPPGHPDAPAPNRLFAQQLDGTFIDVTEAAGIGDAGYGQGVAIGDVDNDGDADVYVTNYGADALYHNNGNGTFDLDSSCPSNEAWGTSATFGDYDRDGYLDLYVANYVQFDPATACHSLNTSPDYCHPQAFDPAADRLFRNNGDGTFTDVSERSGIASLPGRGLGVVCLDLTGDGWVDFYVANDGEANQLWVNQGDGTFVEEAISRGLAFNTYGRPEASMGIAVADVNRDTHPDVFATHLRNETNTLYIASPHSVFTDMSGVAGFDGRDVPLTGFGCGFLDFDNDSDLDLVIVNGAVKRRPVIEGTKANDFWSFYAEPNLLFQNIGVSNEASQDASKMQLQEVEQVDFVDVSLQAPDFTRQFKISRGLAFGDIDRDGDVDMVVSSVDNHLNFFRNDATTPEYNWLVVRAIMHKRDALGAQVALKTEAGTLTGFVLPGASYLSSSEPSVHFGLGKINTIQEIEILWQDGKREKYPGVPTNRRITVYQGKGRAF